MSRLGDIESAIVSHLAAATFGGSPVFAVVRGASGGPRPSFRDALRRERPPAAYVAFIEEPTAPETRPDLLGAHFSIVVAARALRAASNPRLGDSSSLGAFTLLDQVRAQLDGYSPTEDVTLQCLHEKFIDADDRVAIYEALYRAAPIVELVNAPAAPGDIAGHETETEGEVSLEWDQPVVDSDAGPAEYYRLYRKRAGESGFSLLDTATKSDLQKLLASQPTGETLQYYVTAVNVGGEGEPSGTVVVVL